MSLDIIDTIRGRLVVQKNKIQGDVDPNDIAFKVTTDYTNNNAIIAASASTGVQVRKGVFNVGMLYVTEVACDSVQTWTNDFDIDFLLIDDQIEYNYPHDKNDAGYKVRCHKDVLQMFRSEFENGEYHLLRDEMVIGVRVGKVDATIIGEEKGAFMVSEVGGIGYSRFFENGIVFNTTSENPYLFSAEKVIDVVFGSPEHPIDPNKISNKSFRIGNIKEDNLRCGAWTIHAYAGLKLELSESARSNLNLITYER